MLHYEKECAKFEYVLNDSSPIGSWSFCPKSSLPSLVYFIILSVIGQLRKFVLQLGHRPGDSLSRFFCMVSSTSQKNRNYRKAAKSRNLFCIFCPLNLIIIELINNLSLCGLEDPALILPFWISGNRPCNQRNWRHMSLMTVMTEVKCFLCKWVVRIMFISDGLKSFKCGYQRVPAKGPPGFRP